MVAERDEKGAKGLCYFCDHSSEMGQMCQSKRTQLFLLEIPKEDQDEHQEEEEVEVVDFEILKANPCI